MSLPTHKISRTPLQCLARCISGVGLILAAQISFAQTPSLEGLWKTIDDQTGYSRADVLVSKNANGQYTGKIVAIRPLPYKPLNEFCNKCKGELKDKPFVGLVIMRDFVAHPNKPGEFINGEVLDPLSGKTYKGKAKLNSSGRRLQMRGYVGISALGRTTTWIRADDQ